MSVFERRLSLVLARLDVVIAVAFLVGGFVLGAWYVRMFQHTGATQEFAQPQFGAAVALACGRGFVDPGYAPSPAVADFLASKRDRLACSDLPADAPSRPPNLTQGLYRYLMTAVAAVWKIRGISWSGLWPLFGLAYGATVAVAYLLFRSAMLRLVAIAATFLVLLSALHLGFLPYLRDYAKAPFILGLIVIMVRMVKGPLLVGRVLRLAGVFGAVLGIGFGFRNDLLILVPPFIAVSLFCVPGPKLATMKPRLACLAVAALAFIVTAWPVLSAYGRGSNTGHVMLLGLQKDFDGPLGIRGSIYDWGYRYDDGFANVLVNSFTERTAGHSVAYLSREYDQAMVAYILQIVRHFPADVLLRAYASALKAVELPFAVGIYMNEVPHGIRDGWLHSFYRAAIPILLGWAGWGGVILVSALVVVGWGNPAAAVWLLVFLIYLAGYPAIQFQGRHFFHLEFITWLAAGFLISRFLSLLATVARSPRAWLGTWTWRAPMRALIAVVAGVLIVSVPIAALRGYQSSHVRTLLSEYFDAPHVPVALQQTMVDGQTIVQFPDLWTPKAGGSLASADPSDWAVQTRYLLVELSPSRCDAIALPITFRYRHSHPTADFSREFLVRFDRDPQPTFVLFAAFAYESYAQFTELRAPVARAGCIAGAYLMSDVRRFPLLLNVVYPWGWQNRRLYHTLTNGEADEAAQRERPRLFTVPAVAVRRAVADAVLSTDDMKVTYRAPIVSVPPRGPVRVHGEAEARYSTLLQFDAQHASAASVLVAEGEVHEGGVSFGLIKDERFVVIVNVAGPGPFLAVVRPPAAGDYALAMTNFVPDPIPQLFDLSRAIPRLFSNTRMFNDVTVERLGWTTDVPPPD